MKRALLLLLIGSQSFCLQSKAQTSKPSLNQVVEYLNDLTSYRNERCGSLKIYLNGGTLQSEHVMCLPQGAMDIFTKENKSFTSTAKVLGKDQNGNTLVENKVFIDLDDLPQQIDGGPAYKVVILSPDQDGSSFNKDRNEIRIYGPKRWNYDYEIGGWSEGEKIDYWMCNFYSEDDIWVYRFRNALIYLLNTYFDTNNAQSFEAGQLNKFFETWINNPIR
jgi:hypothetical protein